MLSFFALSSSAKDEYEWSETILNLRDRYYKQDLAEYKDYIDSHINEMRNIDLSPYMILDSLKNSFGGYNIYLTWLGKRDRFIDNEGGIDFDKALQTIVYECKHNNYGHHEDALLASLSTCLDKVHSISFWVNLPNDDVDFCISLMHDMTRIGGEFWHEDAIIPERKKNEVMVLDSLYEPEPVYYSDGVDSSPSFPGGRSALDEFLSENLKYPEYALENGIEGKVYIGFIVEKDGSLSDISIYDGIDLSLNIEALRFVKKLPNFIPGKKNGETIRCHTLLPISFKIQE